MSIRGLLALRLTKPSVAQRSSELRLEPALRIALIFAVISLFYIMVSDRLVEQIIADSRVGVAQTAKGAIFVSLSAVVIYFLIRAELKKQERLRKIALRAQRLESIGQLSTVMAHDFNNILTVVIGALEMSEDTIPLENPARLHLATAISAADRAGRLTHRMLVFARQSQLPCQPVDVNKCAQEMTPILNLATGEQVSLRYDLSEGLPPVNAEPCKLENILLNLIINARDAMQGGGEVVLATARERIHSPLTEGAWTVPPGDYVTVLVRDTGHGMSKRVMQEALNPFYTTKPWGKGTGLGLTTLRDGMQAWNGHLVITSATGVGTTVKMYLTPAQHQVASIATKKAPDMRVSRKAETILLVENEADVRAAVADQLKRLGYKVRTAANVSEANEVLRTRGTVDLLLSDIVLDGSITGVALAKQARSANKDLKIILMSGYSDPFLTAEMANFADLGWLGKPFDRSTLDRELRKLLD